MGTPYKRAPDSPSRQLLYELNQLAISAQEGFYAHLDQENEQREDIHKRALAAAARKHDRVREAAEIEKQRLEVEREAQLRQQEEAQKLALEKQRHEFELGARRREAERARLAEQQERELANAQREAKEAADRRNAERDRQQAEESRRQQDRIEAEQKRQNDIRAAEAKAKEAENAAQKARLEPKTIAPPSNGVTQAQTQLKTPTSHLNPDWEAEHARFLEIHKQLKGLRKLINSHTKEQPDLKAAVGDMRRDIKKSVGQLTGENRRKPLSTIISSLKRALNFPEPKVNVALFLARPPPNMPPGSDGPAVLLYLLNIFAKAIVAQFIDEAGVNPKAADPVGIVASHIFALGDFRWHGISLIDILIAKLHVVAPALFGIYGSEQTAAGKERMGWWREDGRSEGPYIPPQRHFERMTGLGAGFAALSLRNYEKAKVENPFPDRHYWDVLARIASVPAEEVTQTHFVLLKGLIENYETKFIGFFGGAAVAALRHLVVELPRKCPPSATSKSLGGLADVLRREKRLVL